MRKILAALTISVAVIRNSLAQVAEVAIFLEVSLRLEDVL